VYFCSHDFKWKGSDALKNPSPHIGQGIALGAGILSAGALKSLQK
jgi:hypothetical protein